MSDAEARAVEPGRGMSWLGEGWALFKQAPGIWIALFVVWIVIMVVLQLVPVLGSLAVSLLGPVFIGGVMLGCQALKDGKPLEIGHLFAGFSGPALGQLVLVGVLTLAGTVLIMLIAGSLMVGMMTSVLSGDPVAMEQLGVGGAFAALLALALFVPLVMATWFAPALVVLGKRGAVEAMKASFSGCLKNLAPFLIYGVLALLIAIVAAIPFGLGFLVAGPVFVASAYAGYKDLFV